MNPIIHQRPEPICETLALLYLSENLEIMIRLLGAIDSEAGDELAFYREHEACIGNMWRHSGRRPCMMNILTSFSVICV